MNEYTNNNGSGISRRRFIKLAAGGAACLAGGIAPGILRTSRAAEARLAPYLEAKIDWQQVSGERIKALMLPAHYTKKFMAVTPQYFTELTGIEVDYELIPPREMREKSILDLATGAGNYFTQDTDPMYFALYEANGWVDPLGPYLNDPKLTDQKWFNLKDIVPLWLEHNTVNGKLLGLPLMGEATFHYYRTDIYEALGLTPPETLDAFMETAKRAHNYQGNVAGAVLRGFRGAGQNMYIWPSLFRSYGGVWFDANGKPNVNSDAGYGSLQFYVDLLRNYSAPGVENWNWPEEMEAFAGGTVAQFIDGSAMASVIENPAKSKVAGKVGYQRWPKGPADKRVTSIWNWGLPINGALNRRQKIATWLYIQWAASRETQMLTASYKETPDAVVRSGVTRLSLWEDPKYRKLVPWSNYADVMLASLKYDTDPDWRPRVPQWPKIGEILAVAIQAALVGQMGVKEALDDANKQIAKVMRV